MLIGITKRCTICKKEVYFRVKDLKEPVICPDCEEKQGNNEQKVDKTKAKLGRMGKR